MHMRKFRVGYSTQWSAIWRSPDCPGSLMRI